MTSHQTQERRASLLPSAAKAEGATRSPHDAPSAPIREETNFPGPHSPTVSGGIPGTPSSDALRAQKSGGTGIPVRGRDAEGVTHHRKSLRAANEFTDSPDSPAPNRKGWTAEDDRLMREMALDGRSATDVGNAIGRSRNAVLGRATRIGVKFSATGGPRKRLRPVKVQPERPAKPKSNAKPAPRVFSHDIELLKENWIKTHGAPRRFERGETTDYEAIRDYLAEFGYRVTYHLMRYSVSNGRGRPKLLTRTQLIELYDEFRTAEGLAPILAEAS
ncbi:hypothetical protein JF546_02600 [Nitratireductor aquimarinus]|uniref:GcrA family cell cycle regulator n=1 Tax=Nitratireductor aquimarinus TaxID=889300 RepID=UPI001A9020E7|nr:GcrA family cell cycle regulator [Nitratireductor aquimarinus]MBN8241898.1 hypothetical protein [Nitratireductor aquimarinus]MBY6130284.1 hypothetical protein [Nitratireductor aquimarinus]MCA1305087.1 hypothetical protein [Nitratireductor aquimarinus]